MNRLVVTSKMSSRYFEPSLPHLEKYTLKNYIEKFHFPYLKLEEESQYTSDKYINRIVPHIQIQYLLSY